MILLLKKFHDLMVEFHDFSITKVIFHDFPRPENFFLRFHAFPGCAERWSTICTAVVLLSTFVQTLTTNASLCNVKIIRPSDTDVINNNRK